MWKIMRENLEDLTSPNLWRSLVAELVGTMFLVLLGCGAASGPMSAGKVPDVLQVSLTFGLIMATMVWCLSHVSGGYINPAIALGAVVTRRISIVRGLLYIVAEVLGGLVGAGMLYGLSPDNARGFLGVNGLREINEAQGFGVELLVTFVLVFTFLASTDEKRTDRHGSAPLTIGLAVVACHLFAVSFRIFMLKMYMILVKKLY
jgi:aquaporin-4